MRQELEPGIELETEIIVATGDTADALGSGGVMVLATPRMITEMEKAAALAVQPYLDEGAATVGTLVDIRHLAATPVGMTVRTRAVLRQVDGRRLVFDVEARDEREEIGRGVHERFIINRDKFTAKAATKLDGLDLS